MAASLSKTDRAKIELWTSRKLVFMVDGKYEAIKAHTHCYKPPYTKGDKAYIENMEQKSAYRPPGVKAVCVVLRGQRRYVWRTDVLTEKEYDESRQRNREAARAVFGKKRRGFVDKGGQK